MKTLKMALAMFTFMNISVAIGNTGRHGPDTEGLSIPVRLDRVVSVEAFKAATKNCEAGLANSIMSQILRQEVDAASDFDGGAHVFYISSSSSEEADSSPTVIRLRFHLFSDPSYINLETTQVLTESKKVYKVSEEIFDLAKRFKMNSTISGGLQIKVNTQMELDEIGGLMSTSVKSFQLINTPLVRTTYIEIDNSFTKFTLPIVIDEKEFKQCLQNQLSQNQ